MIAQGISGGTVKHLITSRPDRSTTNRNIRQRRIAAVQSLSSNATSITGINAGERPPGEHWDNSGIYDRRPRLTRMIAQGTDGGTSKHFVKSRTRQSDRKQEYPNVAGHSKRRRQRGHTDHSGTGENRPKYRIAQRINGGTE